MADMTEEKVLELLESTSRAYMAVIKEKDEQIERQTALIEELTETLEQTLATAKRDDIVNERILASQERTIDGMAVLMDRYVPGFDLEEWRAQRGAIRSAKRTLN